MEQVTNDALLFRNADREIRGVIFGIANSFGFLGQFCFSIAGGWLYDNYDPKGPFMLVGCMDAAFFVIAVLAAFFGILKNDIAIRKREQEEKAGKYVSLTDKLSQI